MAKRLVNLLKNIAAVEHPANRRSFLVIKSVKKDEHAMTFDDAMFGRRIHKVYMALSEHYGALMETIDSVRMSGDEDKPAAVKAALASYLGAVQKAMPDMLAAMDAEDEDMEKGALNSGPLVKVRDRLNALIKEADMAEPKKDDKKAPDATMLAKMGSTIAAMFARATGASDEDIAILEKAATGVSAPVIPAEVQAQLAKAATDNAALTTRLEKAELETVKLREEAELRKFAEEVSEFKSIGLDPAKDNALLKAVSEKLPKEQADRIREIFKSAVAQKAASTLFQEIGSGAEGVVAGSASSEIEQKTGAVMAELRKSNDKVTMEQARDSVFRSNPGLYERWMRETTVKI